MRTAVQKRDRQNRCELMKECKILRCRQSLDEPDRVTDRITDRITEKKKFKEKKIQNNPIVYEIVINKRSGKLKYAK